MPELKKTVGVAVDLAGCPNRCRHCYLGVGPNGRLAPEVLRKVASAFWEWRRSGENSAYFEQVYVSSGYREPDFSDDYRELYALERELSRAAPRRYELLSIWRLARDEGYAEWARGVGPRTCQVSFFGLEEVNDHFHRRRGAFRDALVATQRLLEAEMIPRWQVFLTKPGMADLQGLVDLADELRLRERVAELGAEFDIFCHPPGPGGEAWNMRDLGVTEEDISAVPPALMEATTKHFGGRVNWVSERAALEKLEAGDSQDPYVPDEAWFFVNADLDVHTNYGGEIGPAWRLGTFRDEGVDAILRRFEQDDVPGLHAAFHVPFVELGRRFADVGNPHVYDVGDIPYIWIHRYAAHEAEQPA
ncbi:MAG: radical SAM protein [Planctomycetota bacterium]|jgi:hypothetical protein